MLENQRVVIPKALRAEIAQKAHVLHQGVAASLRRARDSVFWPSMGKDIQEVVEECEVCAEYQPRNVQQPMQSHEIPSRPWSRLGCDLFSLNSKDYIVLVDSYSDFIEVCQLNDTSTATIVEFMKQQFSRDGIPDVLVTDNCPQFTSQEFNIFSRKWEFKHVSSSPYHPKSNGKAESAAKIVKNLFKKASRDNRDPWLSMLDYRNTPTEGMNSSPSQRLMSRRTRTLVSVVSALLYPKVITDVKERFQVKRRMAKSYHDRTSKTLPPLEVGQEVRVAGQKNRAWDSGECLEQLSDRSYLVRVDGEVKRRNRVAPRDDNKLEHHSRRKLFKMCNLGGRK